MKITALKIQLLCMMLSATSVVTLSATTAMAADDQNRSTAEDFLKLNLRPIAIGRHGVGPNTGANPALPIENTVDSVREAYKLGARVVEVDVQLTQDNKLAVFHDDFLRE
jgi:hypothetical protein